MAEHALLSASGAKKWITCTPSARLEASLPDENSAEAREGTIAHDLVEIILNIEYNAKERPAFLDDPEQLVEAGFNQDMLDAALVFLKEAKKITDPLREKGIPFAVFIEQKLDYSPWVPEGFGTGDLVVVARHCLWVRDFKYGKGVRVLTEENEQMMCYGLGAYNELSFAFEGINEVDIGIVQPRMNNIDCWRVSLDTLLGWGAAIAPRAQLAWNGEGVFVPGPHCDSAFCRARATCRARAEWALSLATKEFGDKPKGDLLLPDEIAKLLPHLEGIAKWATSLQAYSLDQAVNAGVTFPGWRLVEGRSNRYITDKTLAAMRLVAGGIPKEKLFTEPQLVGITALEALVGSKKKFAELLDDILAKPPGKPVLVPEDDKRPTWQPKATADDDFKDD